MKTTSFLWALLPVAFANGCASYPPPEGIPTAVAPPGTFAWDGGASLPSAIPPSVNADDQVVANVIRTGLRHDPLLANSSMKIAVSVNRGVVLLAGQLPVEPTRTMLLERIAAVPGVDRIEVAAPLP